MALFNQRNVGLLIMIFSMILIVILGFIKIDQDKKDAFLCNTIHSSPGLSILDCPVHQSNISWYMTIAFGFGFLLLGSGIYLYFVPWKQMAGVEKREEYKAKPVDLDDEEVGIYDLLRDKNGSMYQSDLVKETGFTKVHITRILDKMEGKGILERKRRGMTNIVILR